MHRGEPVDDEAVFAVVVQQGLYVGLPAPVDAGVGVELGAVENEGVDVVMAEDLGEVLVVVVEVGHRTRRIGVADGAAQIHLGATPVVHLGFIDGVGLAHTAGVAANGDATPRDDAAVGGCSQVIAGPKGNGAANAVISPIDTGVSPFSFTRALATAQQHQILGVDGAGVGHRQAHIAAQGGPRAR